jgi:thiamine biosynthesis protein ThiS
MKIQLNGHPHQLSSVITLDELLQSIGFGGKPVVVELNEQAIFPRDYSRILIQDSARVEIVTLAAGG